MRVLGWPGKSPGNAYAVLRSDVHMSVRMYVGVARGAGTDTAAAHWTPPLQGQAWSLTPLKKAELMRDAWAMRRLKELMSRSI